MEQGPLSRHTGRTFALVTCAILGAVALAGVSIEPRSRLRWLTLRLCPLPGLAMHTMPHARAAWVRSSGSEGEGGA